MTVPSPPSTPGSAPAPSPPSLLARLRHRLSERARYGSLASWLWSFYDTLLARPRMRWLPGYRSVRGLRVAGLDRAAGDGRARRPVFVRLGTTDLSVLREIFFFGEYDQLKRLNAPEVRTIIDLGANVGMTIRLWQEWFPAARVVAVEPDADNLRIAALNADVSTPSAAAGKRERGAAPGLTLLRACAAGSNRMVDLNRQGGEWAFTMSDATGSEQIEALTLPDILARAGIGPDEPLDLLKCDIEGAEQELFENCAAWLGRVNVLMVELHGRFTPERFVHALRAAGCDFELEITPKAADLWVAFGRRRQHGS